MKNYTILTLDPLNSNGISFKGFNQYDLLLNLFSKNLLKGSLNEYYSSILLKGYWLPTFTVNTFTENYFILYDFISIFFQINLIMFILYGIFFLSYLENYIKQLFYLNTFAKFFILNENEKEVGPVDDFIFFAVLFLLTLSSFIIVSLFVIIFNINGLVWLIGALILVAILILTIPLNLFIDFGVAFTSYIRGSSSSSSLIKELLFDIISTTTVFIRFVIQNIRFLFIFLAIFELLEWVFSNNSNLFFINYYSNNNIFINSSMSDYLNSDKSMNVVILNSVLFIIFYFYYSLHLLFLLLVQITIYIGISIWLFFFLYSTRFLNKYEKYFTFKR